MKSAAQAIPTIMSEPHASEPITTCFIPTSFVVETFGAAVREYPYGAPSGRALPINSRSIV
jgi:hypothetical protein